MKNKSVAIIGGGFTGLTAAYELARNGVQVTVLEAKPMLPAWQRHSTSVGRNWIASITTGSPTTWRSCSSSTSWA